VRDALHPQTSQPMADESRQESTIPQTESRAEGGVKKYMAVLSSQFSSQFSVLSSQFSVSGPQFQFLQSIVLSAKFSVFQFLVQFSELSRHIILREERKVFN